ncbi:MAG TPA: phosphoribosyltransferase family protein [Lutibacter sp.]
MEYKNISDLNNIIIKKLYLVPSDIDLVVGIPRSGIIPAVLIALYKNLPYCDFYSFIRGNLNEGGERTKDFDLTNIKNVLIVDDTVCSGNSLIKAKEELSKTQNNYKFTFSTIYIKPGNEYLVDIFFEKVEMPRVFQWNIFHHHILQNSCVDIDGVLCIDPTEAENDDGEKYIEFIINVKPLYIPTTEINTIVSCRLEKYRELTEYWLKENGVKYKKLILLDLPDKEARIKWNKYGEFKAKIFSENNYSLFIESSLKQAKIISEGTNKAVYCIENFEMIKPQINFKGKVKKVFIKIGFNRLVKFKLFKYLYRSLIRY